MSAGKTSLKRRRMRKTDYRKRRSLLQPRLPRLVVRNSVQNMVVQVVAATLKGDSVITSAHTKQLVKDFGWKAGCGNIPSAYLTGLLVGYRALQKDVVKAVLDTGLDPMVKGSKSAAALKGALDAGLNISSGQEIHPSDSRIKGEHIAAYAAILQKENPELYKQRFSASLSMKTPPEKLPEHFEKVRGRIVKAFKAKG